MNVFAALALALAAAVASTVALPTAAGAQGVSGTALVGALLKPGATVYGPSGIKIGTIESIGDKTAVLDSRAGRVLVPLRLFGPGSKGLFLDRTFSQLEQMARAEPAAPAS